MGLPGKLILGDYLQENRTSRRPSLLLSFPGRPIFIQLPPALVVTAAAAAERGDTYVTSTKYSDFFTPSPLVMYRIHQPAFFRLLFGDPPHPVRTSYKYAPKGYIPMAPSSSSSSSASSSVVLLRRKSSSEGENRLVQSSGQTETVSVRFRPKSSGLFWFRYFGFLPFWCLG